MSCITNVGQGRSYFFVYYLKYDHIAFLNFATSGRTCARKAAWKTSTPVLNFII